MIWLPFRARLMDTFTHGTSEDALKTSLKFSLGKSNPGLFELTSHLMIQTDVNILKKEKPFFRLSTNHLSTGVVLLISPTIIIIIASWLPPQ